MPRAVSWISIFVFPPRLGVAVCLRWRTAQSSRRPSLDPGRRPPEWSLAGHAEQGGAGLRARPSQRHRDPQARLSQPHVLIAWGPRSAPGLGGGGAALRRPLSCQALRSSEALLRLRGGRL